MLERINRLVNDVNGIALVAYADVEKGLLPAGERDSTSDIANMARTDHIWGNSIAGTFAAFVYFLPPFSGAISDRIGFKNGLILAFGLLAVGYFFLGIFLSQIAVIFFLIVLMVGASDLMTCLLKTIILIW